MVLSFSVKAQMDEFEANENGGVAAAEGGGGGGEAIEENAEYYDKEIAPWCVKFASYLSLLSVLSRGYAL